MPLRYLPVLLLFVVATSFAQEKDTNFPAGPRYLITTGNPMLLGPISTPSLNLSGTTLAGTSDVPRPVEMPAFAPVETIVYLHDVYWGDHLPGVSLARWLEPPIMTPDQASWYMNYVTSQATATYQVPYAETGEFPGFSGPELPAGPNVVELTGGPMPANLPASMFDPGVTGMTNTESLQQRGYGVSLGEVAAYWKAHKKHASHLIIDEDLRRK
jgi:hypothetical protein